MVLTVMGLVFLLCGIGLVCWSEWESIPPLTDATARPKKGSNNAH